VLMRLAAEGTMAISDRSYRRADGRPDDRSTRRALYFAPPMASYKPKPRHAAAFGGSPPESLTCAGTRRPASANVDLRGARSGV
jgi:hypothetical protein